MSKIASTAATALKKRVRDYVIENYEGQAVDVVGHIEIDAEVLTNQPTMTVRFQVKKVVADMWNAVVIDEQNLDYIEDFSFNMFESGVIIDE